MFKNYNGKAKCIHEKDPSPEEMKKKRKQKENKKLEALNTKLYRDRVKQKWDRSW